MNNHVTKTQSIVIIPAMSQWQFVDNRITNVFIIMTNKIFNTEKTAGDRCLIDFFDSCRGYF